MSRITPVPWEELDPEVRELIETAQACKAIRNDTTVPRLWALRPALAKAQLPIQTRFHDSNILDERLLKLVRLRIAALNDCRACSTRARATPSPKTTSRACPPTMSGSANPAARIAVRGALRR